MAETVTYIARTEEEDRRFIQQVVKEMLENIELADLRHKMRLETGTCYARDLAWLWDLSVSRMRDRLRESDVQPVSTEGKSKLWDVDEANAAIAA
ncbi:hypothetical protein BSZ35_19095 [Salinibacter sp. 10B]|uniref:hypothetical protein n=1 Tax=Salinibacter sp. 10B TaxID=1923971 RepID=UPI000CF3B330|nr:hypothetical protein [Salinibacter sp. 10B]PQJ26756.1 hypothetical protein BSZ35_19095 [Salinibacter sp. 10B]